MVATVETIEAVEQATGAYKYGFVTDIETEKAPKGLSEDVIRFISAKKMEPEWMLNWRLKAYRYWLKMTSPDWAKLNVPPIDYDDIYYYAAPKSAEVPKSLDEVDPELLRTYEKLGIPLNEQKMLAGVAVDAVIDSVSVATTFREELAKAGVIFCPISEAIREYPDLVRKYMGSVVPVSDNYFSALNSAVFTDGSFVYIPKGVRCPMELSTYFRINEQNTGQFERTLIIADDESYVSYLEGCTAPQRDENQLHAAVVELVALTDAEIKYSTVQNWYPGDENGKGGIYNFVTKRGVCRGDRSKISWTQVETGSAITWKYPSCVLRGKDSVGEFYSVALTNNMQQADTGTKMVHVGPRTRSTIVSKGISAGRSSNSYRGLVQMGPNAKGARNYSQCDSMLIGDQAAANTYPYIRSQQPQAAIEHEASTCRISEDQLFYLQSRGIGFEEAVSMMVSGFCRDVFNQLPMEFAAEADKLLALTWQAQVQRDLSDCLVLDLDGVESTTIYRQLGEGAFKAVMLDWRGSYPDPEAYLTPLLSCTSVEGNICMEGEAAISGSFWSAPGLQTALLKSDTLTGDARRTALDHVDHLSADGAAYIPVWLDSPRAWAQLNLNPPRFDGSGQLMLAELERRQDGASKKGATNN